MLDGTDRERGIEFVEKYLLAHPGLDFDVFKLTAQKVAADAKLLATVLTRWLLRGEHVLCSGIASVVRDFHAQSANLEVEPTEIQPLDPLHIIFLARKVVGYLFLYPVPAASSLVSLMKQTDDGPTLQALGDLLEYPLLMSFPGAAGEFVTRAIGATSEKVGQMLERAHRNFESYLQTLKSMPDIPVLHLSEAQREAQHRRLSRLMARSYKEVQKESFFFGHVRRSLILYGEASVYHSLEPGGSSNRVAMALRPVRTNFEMPRMDPIDPVGLEIFVRTCKSEQLKP